MDSTEQVKFFQGTDSETDAFDMVSVGCCTLVPIDVWLLAYVML